MRLWKGEAVKITPSEVTAGLKQMKQIDTELAEINREMRPILRRQNRLWAKRRHIERTIACKAIPGCRGFAGHGGCHNV